MLILKFKFFSLRTTGFGLMCHFQFFLFLLHFGFRLVNFQSWLLTHRGRSKDYKIEFLKFTSQTSIQVSEVYWKYKWGRFTGLKKRFFQRIVCCQLPKGVNGKDVEQILSRWF